MLTLLYAACQYLEYLCNSYVKNPNMNYIYGMFFKVVPDGLHEVRDIKYERNLPAQINAVRFITVCIDVQ